MSTKQILTLNIPLSTKLAAYTKWISSCYTAEQLINMEFIVRREIRANYHYPNIVQIEKEMSDTLQMQRVYLAFRNADIPTFRNH